MVAPISFGATALLACVSPYSSSPKLGIPMKLDAIKSYVSPAAPDWTAEAAPHLNGKRGFSLVQDSANSTQTARATLKEEIAFLETERSAPPLFVSYYTENTPYEDLANRLRTSLDKFGLPHRIEAIASRGSWVANTGLKSEFIAKAWQESEGPICWVDADAEILRAPQFVFDSPFDFAIVRRKGWYDISSFVYFGKAPAVGEMIQNWSELCNVHRNIWDQPLLTLAWYEASQRHQLASLWLNDGIFRFPRPAIRDLRDRVFFYPFQRKIRPFVDQKQASNDLKKFVDTSKRKDNELGSDDVSEIFRNALCDGRFDLPATVEAMFGFE